MRPENRRPCARCHGPIAYDGPRYLPNRKHRPSCTRDACLGCRTVNPRSLVVGHIVSRYDARRAGWPEERTNGLANTRPECWRCSNSSGARAGNKIQAAKAKKRQQVRNAYTERW